MVPGNESVDLLLRALHAQFEENCIELVGGFTERDDALGFRIPSKRRFLFSVSTHAGVLEPGRYDLQISIVDDSVENGSIVHLEEVDMSRLLELVDAVRRGVLA